MTDPKLRAAAALAAVALLGACGGDGKPSAAPSGTSAPTVSSTPGATATNDPGATTTASHAPGTSHAPGSSATSGGTAGPSGSSPTPSAAYSPTRVELDAKLSKTCVKPGDPITLTVNARPKMKIIFDTTYADGKDGATYGGFERDGNADANGRYAKTWTVSPAAAQGDAEVILAGVDSIGTGRKRLPFKVSLTC
jgi:hypothetical protein